MGYLDDVPVYMEEEVIDANHESALKRSVSKKIDQNGKESIANTQVRNAACTGIRKVELITW